jgi:hypothetical protein
MLLAGIVSKSEVADLLSQGIEHLKIPASIWQCSPIDKTNKEYYYSKILNKILDKADQFTSQYINFLFNQFGVRADLDIRTNRAMLAFTCGAWDGCVGVIKSVPDIISYFTCIASNSCVKSVTDSYRSFKNAPITDKETEAIICNSNDQLCKLKHIVYSAYKEATKDQCSVAYSLGSIIGLMAAIYYGDLAASESVVASISNVSKSLKIAARFLKFCDKISWLGF